MAYDPIVTIVNKSLPVVWTNDDISGENEIVGKDLRSSIIDPLGEFFQFWHLLKISKTTDDILLWQ